MNPTRRKVLLISFVYLALASASIAQGQSIFRNAVQKAWREYDRFVGDRLFRNEIIRLVSSYKDATVRRQVLNLNITSVENELRAGDEILALLLEGSDKFLFKLKFNVESIHPLALDQLADSFLSNGYERVMSTEFKDNPYSDFGLQMLEALAFYAVTARALVESGDIDQSIFQSGEFCILPFWPFC